MKLPTIIDQIKAMKPGETVKDEGERSSVKGLHIRALASKKSFMLYYRTKGGIQRRPRIGEYGPMTLARARDIARELLDRVNRGEDPQGNWAKARGEMTVAELFDRTWSIHWNAPRYIDSGHAKDVMGHWTRSLAPAFGHLRLSEVTPLKIRTWMGGFSERPYAANRALEVLSKMYSLAEETELTGVGTNPCRAVKKFTEKKRGRYATHEELIAIAAALEELEHRYPRGVAFLRVAQITGARLISLERAEWDWLERFDHRGEEWGKISFIGKSTYKTGEEEALVIPPPAMRIIDTLPRTSPTIFGVKIPRKLWSHVKEKTGITDLWSRDSRRTFATIGFSGGVDKAVIGQVLNHHSAQTTSIYAKLDSRARLDAVAEISRKIEEIV